MEVNELNCKYVKTAGVQLERASRSLIDQARFGLFRSMN